MCYIKHSRHTALRFRCTERKIVEKITCSGHNENSIVPAVHVYHANSVIKHEGLGIVIFHSFVLNRVYALVEVCAIGEC